MKKLVFLLVFFPFSLFSQIYVDKHEINADDKVKFCKVTIQPSLKKGKTVSFDYGQKLKRMRPNTRVFGNDKKEIFFNGIIDVMNFMTSNNWEIFDGPYLDNETGNDYCIFRKNRE